MHLSSATRVLGYSVLWQNALGQCCPCPYLSITISQKLCKLVVRIPRLCACDYPELSCVSLSYTYSAFRNLYVEHREHKCAYHPLVCTPTGCKYSLCHFRNPFGIEPTSDCVSPQDLRSCGPLQICCFMPFFPLIKNNRSLSQREALRINAWMSVIFYDTIARNISLFSFIMWQV